VGVVIVVRLVAESAAQLVKRPAVFVKEKKVVASIRVHNYGL
jgi:hypothetical protein